MISNKFKEKIDFFEKFFSQKANLPNKPSTPLRLSLKIDSVTKTNRNRNENNNFIELNKTCILKVEDSFKSKTVERTDEQSDLLSLNSKLSKSSTEISIDNKLLLNNDQFIQTKNFSKYYQKPNCNEAQTFLLHSHLEKNECEKQVEKVISGKEDLSSIKLSNIHQLSKTDTELETYEENIKKEDSVLTKNLKILHKMLLTAKCYCVLVFEEKSIEDCKKLIKVLCEAENFVFNNLMKLDVNEIYKKNDLLMMNIQNKLCDFHLQNIRLRTIFGDILKCKLMNLALNILELLLFKFMSNKAQ
jgi:hypothetical protein